MTLQDGRLKYAGLVVLTVVVNATELQQFRLEPAPQSEFMLTVEKTGLLAGKVHHFEFPKYTGTLRFDPETPGRSQVEFAVQSGSLVCKDDWVSDKDRAKIVQYALHDMLAVDRYPEIRFHSTQVEANGANQFVVSGPLTIRDVTRPVQVRIQRESADGAASSTYRGSCNLRLKDFGLKPPPAALGAVGTKNEMQLTFRLRATPAAGSSTRSARPPAHPASPTR